MIDNNKELQEIIQLLIEELIRYDKQHELNLQNRGIV